MRVSPSGPQGPRDVVAEPKVSLIICSRNRPKMLADAVSSILRGSLLPNELIVVDQSDEADENPSLPCVDGPCEIRHERTDTKGASRASNVGAAMARYDRLVFTHDDILADGAWLETLVQALEDGGEGTIVTGSVLATAPETPGGFAPALKVGDRPESYEGRVGHDVLKPMNMAIFRKTFEAIGGFDVRLGPGTAFPGAEDSDLGFRILESGNRILYLPLAVVYHRAWRSPREYLPLRWRYGVAQGAFYAKHFTFGDSYILKRVGGDVLSRILRFPKRLMIEPHRALGDPLFIVGNLVGAIRWCSRECRLRPHGGEE